MAWKAAVINRPGVGEGTIGGGQDERENAHRGGDQVGGPAAAIN